jgi:hypothetical protein
MDSPRGKRLRELRFHSSSAVVIPPVNFGLVEEGLYRSVGRTLSLPSLPFLGSFPELGWPSTIAGPAYRAEFSFSRATEFAYPCLARARGAESTLVRPCLALLGAFYPLSSVIDH